jgi:hypothetical protein
LNRNQYKEKIILFIYVGIQNKPVLEYINVCPSDPDRGNTFTSMALFFNALAYGPTIPILVQKVLKAIILGMGMCLSLRGLRGLLLRKSIPIPLFSDFLNWNRYISCRQLRKNGFEMLQFCSGRTL